MGKFLKYSAYETFARNQILSNYVADSAGAGYTIPGLLQPFTAGTHIYREYYVPVIVPDEVDDDIATAPPQALQRFALTIDAFCALYSRLADAQRIYLERQGKFAPTVTQNGKQNASATVKTDTQNTNNSSEFSTNHSETDDVSNETGKMTEKYNPIGTASSKTSGVTENERDTRQGITQNGNGNVTVNGSTRTNGETSNTQNSTTENTSENWRDAIDAQGLLLDTPSPCERVLNAFAMLLVHPSEYGGNRAGDYDPSIW